MPAAFRPKAEGDAFLRDLRLATGCVTRDVLTADADQYDPAPTHFVAFGRSGEPTSLRDHLTGGPSGLLFNVRLRYRIVVSVDVESRPAWRAETTAYIYRLMDRDERELLAFHWQPGTAFAGPDHPHLHVSASLTARVAATKERRIDLDKRHLPTAWLSLAAVVRMLIEEFDVRPLHRDWRQRLDRADAALRMRQQPFDARA